MKNTVLVFVLFWLPLLSFAQKEVAPAKPNCDSLFRAGDSHLRQQNLQQALQCYLGAMNCDTRLAGKVGPKIEEVFGRIEKQRRSEQAAKVEAEKQRVEADYQRIEAENLARTTYANDLAYKSQIALRDGLRTEAFRLAEFAHRYVEAGNPNVMQALLNAFYYNDNPAHTPLPWNLFTLEGHTGWVTDVACSSDGRRLATASLDGTAKIWDIQNGHLLLTCQGHTNRVNSVAFSPDGSRLATGADDNTAKIWDPKTGATLTTLRGHDDGVSCVAFSPDGKWIATGATDNTAKIWDAQTGKVWITLPKHDVQVDDVAFSPEGKWLATGSYDTIKVWDWQRGKIRISLPAQAGSSIECIVFSPDGSRIAAGYWDKTAKIWDVQNGEVWLTLEGHSDIVSGITFSPDGSRIATASWDNTAILWDAASGKLLSTLAGHLNSVNSIAFSPDGKMLVTGAFDGTAKIWDAQSGKTSTTLEGHTSWVMDLAFSPDGKRIVTGAIDSLAKIWDARNGQVLTTLQGHTNGVISVAISPDGNWLATGAEDDTVIIWDMQSGKIRTTLQIYPGSLGDVAFSPNGKLLATANFNSIILWDVDSAKMLKKFQYDGSSISRLAFSSDGKRLAAGTTDNNAQIWDVEKGEMLADFQGHTSPVIGVAFSPNGKLLATGAADKLVKIWDVNSGLVVKTFEGHTSAIRAVTFSPDGKWLASGAEENTTKIWDVQSGKLLTSIQGHDNAIFSVVFSPDGKRLATASGDHTAKIWILDADSIIQRQREIQPLSALAMQRLNTWNLGTLLDINPHNEMRLCHTGNRQQIEAFADLAAQNARNSGSLNYTAPDYARAARLYGYAFRLSNDSVLLKKNGELFTRHALDILASHRPDTALHYALSAYRLLPGASTAQHVLARARMSAPAGQGIETEHEPAVLRAAAEYYHKKGQWRRAGQLYERAEKTEHHPQSLTGLHEIMERAGQKVDFSPFLTFTDAADLRQCAAYFLKKERWDEAAQLYEKAETIEHHPDAITGWHYAYRKTGRPFDLQRFLASDNPRELSRYAEYFLQLSGAFELNPDKIPDYRFATRLLEKQIQFDSSTKVYPVEADIYTRLAFLQLSVSDGGAAEVSLGRARQLDPSNQTITSYQLLAALLQGRWAEAEAQFRLLKDTDFDESGFRSYWDVFLFDLGELEAQGITHPDFEKARALLKQE